VVKALVIKNLKKTYSNGVHALGGVTLEIEAGDFFALLGPNGAGKTSIIGITTGLVNKTAGEVSVFGHNIDTETDKAKTYIGLVPQEFNFGIFDKVIDIITTQAGYYGIPLSTARKDAEKYLKALGLWEKRNDQARMLSGGMKRRLMIVRALIHHPKLLILDEPTAGVDIELRHGMWEFLKNLNQEGVTIILTTHYLEEAEQLCRNLAIINKGEIVAMGPMKEVLLNTLSSQAYIFDLKAVLPDKSFEALKQYSPRKLDSVTLELRIENSQNLNEVMGELTNLAIEVRGIRNKTNRLEELFVSLTSGNSSINSLS
jgi:ABC-2 type transport system ATP-binding protein